MDKRELFGDEFFELDYCPSPEEIAERAAEIRAGWDDETRLARLRGWACGTEEDRKAGQRAEAMARAALLCRGDTLRPENRTRG